MALFDQDPTEQDPLFYRGQTPVLGQEVEVRTAGQLPGEFPATGGASRGPAPTPPRKPVFGGPPEAPMPGGFDWEGFEWEVPDAPAPPGRPTGATPPVARSSGPPAWLAQLLTGLGYGSKLAEIWKGLQRPDVPGPAAGYFGTGEVPKFSVTGPENLDWFQLDPANPSKTAFNLGVPGLENVSPDDLAAIASYLPDTFTPETLASAIRTQWGGPSAAAPSLTGTEGAPVLDPSGFNLGVGSVTEAGSGSIGALPGLASAVPWLGAAAAGALAGGLNDPSVAGVGKGAVQGTVTGAIPIVLGSAFGGPIGALAGLALAAGMYGIGTMKGDSPRWPGGYIDIPPVNGVSAAVDPKTGAILLYKGKGQYEWSSQTLEGHRATADQFTEWGVPSPLYPNTTEEAMAQRIASDPEGFLQWAKAKGWNVDGITPEQLKNVTRWQTGSPTRMDAAPTPTTVTPPGQTATATPGAEAFGPAAPAAPAPAAPAPEPEPPSSGQVGAAAPAAPAPAPSSAPNPAEFIAMWGREPRPGETADAFSFAG